MDDVKFAQLKQKMIHRTTHFTDADVQFLIDAVDHFRGAAGRTAIDYANAIDAMRQRGQLESPELRKHYRSVCQRHVQMLQGDLAVNTNASFLNTAIVGIGTMVDRLDPAQWDAMKSDEMSSLTNS